MSVALRWSLGPKTARCVRMEERIANDPLDADAWVVLLAEACAQAGIKKPLLVTDKGLADLPVTQSTLDIMEAAGLGRGMFSEVDPNPNEKNLEAGVAAYKAGGHDGVIAFGGGSGLDLGKMVAFMCGQSRPVWDFEDIGDWWTRADAEAIAPIIARLTRTLGVERVRAVLPVLRELRLALERDDM